MIDISSLTYGECLSLAALTIILCTISFSYLLTRRDSPSSNVPKAVGFPIIGNIADFTPKTVLRTLVQYPTKYGGIVKFSVFNRQGYLLSSAELIKEVFQKRPKRFRRRRSEEYLTDILGLSSGLFNSNGEVWARIRRATAPSFSSLNVKLKFPALLAQVKGFVLRLHDQARDNKTVDMKFESFSFTIRVITVVAFGLSLDNEVTNYFVSSQFMDDIVSFFRFGSEYRLFPAPIMFWKVSPQYKYELEARAANERVTAAAKRVINAKRELLSQPGSIPSAMIDFMIMKEEAHATDALTDEEIIANVKTFFMAGAETTSVAITWLMYILATNHGVRDRIRGEADELMRKNGLDWQAATLSIDDVFSLQYCCAVEREILRLYSPAVAGPLELTDFSASTTLSNQVEVAPGDEVWANVEGVLRDPNAFPDPLVFNPDRWLTKDAELLSRMEAHYFVFGGGARMCPGMHLARAEIMLAMVFVTCCFDVTLDCPTSEINRIMNFAACANKMPVKFSIRQNF